MTEDEIAKLEAKAHDLTGRPLSTPIALTPGQVMALCRLALIGLHSEASHAA